MSGVVSRAWSWRHAIVASDLQPSTRLLLLALSTFMDETGRSCFPSVAQLVAATGLSKNTVLTHLDLARAGGWIEIVLHGYRGQKWRRQEYVAKWPGRDVAGEPLLSLEVAGEDDGAEQNSTAAADADERKGGATIAPPSDVGEAVQPLDQGGATIAPKVVQPLHQDKTSPGTTPLPVQDEREGARATGVDNSAGDDPGGKVDDGKSSDGRTLSVFLLAWPTAAISSKPAMEKAWKALTPAERTAALDHVTPWLAEYRSAGRGKIPAGSTWLADKGWETLAARTSVVKAAAKLVIAPFARAWWWVLFRRVERGEPVQFMIQLAQQGTGYAAGPEDVPSREAEEGLWRLSLRDDGEAFAAWVAHFAARGVRLPRPAMAEFVWMPGPWPPAAGDNARNEERPRW
ncbi:MAG: helix-turn-helix domain-containing protein [Rhodospirillaceae bacterium]